MPFAPRSFEYEDLVFGDGNLKFIAESRWFIGSDNLNRLRGRKVTQLSKPRRLAETGVGQFVIRDRREEFGLRRVLSSSWIPFAQHE
jgi:hypothetical protein